MSSGTRILHAEAFEIAREAGELLKPSVERIKAVGSLRRRRESVGDLEFLAVPFLDTDLFGGDPKPALDPVHQVMREMGDWIKGGPRMMQIDNLLGHKGLVLDLYLCHPPAEWGSLQAIRTGPRELGVQCMISLRKRGYLHAAGHIQKGGRIIPTPTEEDFFNVVGIDCLPPNQRDSQALRLQKEQK